STSATICGRGACGACCRLPVELGNDPLMADKLVMIPIREVLPTATYYLIQRRDTRQTPLTASLITLFRRQSRQLFP
ncbi:hypothetical protein ACLBPA_26495, partial [Klebsiella pneumoniae]